MIWPQYSGSRGHGLETGEACGKGLAGCGNLHTAVLHRFCASPSSEQRAGKIVVELRRKGKVLRELSVSEIPRYTSFPKELTELRKAVILMVMVCYSTRTQPKISKGKRCIEESPGETKRSFLLCVPSQGNLLDLILPATACETCTKCAKQRNH